MQIDKITFKTDQAWLTIRSEEGQYLGCWNCQCKPFVEALHKEMPKKVFFDNKIREAIEKIESNNTHPAQGKANWATELRKELGINGNN